ncbi:MAG: translation initiation factor 1 [Alteromonadaceae bacterium]|jgi:translation initiation factor 1
MKNSFSSLSDLAGAFGRDPITSDDINSATEQQKSSDNSLVYSTNGGRVEVTSKRKSVTPSDGYARVRRETKGRKGKGVVTISGLGIDAVALKELAKKLKKTCGAGGTVVGETIEVQGDKREQIQQVLENSGFKVKFTGG